MSHTVSRQEYNLRIAQRAKTEGSRRLPPLCGDHMLLPNTQIRKAVQPTATYNADTHSTSEACNNRSWSGIWTVEVGKAISAP